MRAEVIGIGAGFQVQPELRADGSVAPPQAVTLTLRKCWQKPAVQMRVEFLYENEEVAYYAVVREA